MSIPGRFIVPSLLISSLLLSACGVDTTGLSPNTSRKAAGNPTASVTVVEYGDLQCPSCKSAYTILNQPLLQKYGSKIRFEFRHFPIRTIHQYAFEAAQASECAADQGKFWEFVDLAYAHQEDLNSDALRTWAKTLSLDEALFDRCVRSEIKGDTIMSDYDQGKQIGVQGTPTFLVNGVRVQSTMEDLSAAIDAALAGGSKEMPL